MQTVLNIKKVSLIFFIITGLLHLSTFALIANDYFSQQAKLVNKLADIPFILTGLIYAFASIRLSLFEESAHKILDTIMFSVLVLALIGLILVNIFIPDAVTT